MFVIVVYDVEAVRVAKVKKICQQYLFWVQRSTFEGNLSPKQLQELKNRIKEIVRPEHDQVKIYIIQQEDALQTLTLGYTNNPEQFIF
ncbi:MAG: CRISPR-associated endonuclease Cas2 [Thermoactinomyces sp.]